VTSRARVAENYQTIEQLEGDSANHEQVDGGDPSGVIAQECLPTWEGGSYLLVR
jgi:hypothetical protein